MTVPAALRVAIVGCGEIAGTHLRALDAVDGVTVVAAVDVDEARRNAIASRAGGAATFVDAAEMLEAVRPDVVHVLTPPSSHTELAVDAMRAGAHVLVEKPMALSVADADRMLSVAEETTRTLGTCHNWLYKPAMLQAIALVEAGRIGDVSHADLYWGIAADGGVYASDPGSHWAWRMRGGIYTNFLPHAISLLQHFLGSDVDVHSALASRQPASAAVVTGITALLNGPGGWGSLTVTTLDRPAMKALDVYGTEGVLRVDLAREICVLQPRRRAPGVAQKVVFGLEHAGQLAVGTARSTAMALAGKWRGNPGMTPLVADFYDAIRQGRPPATGAEEGREMVRVMERLWEHTGPLETPRPTSAEARLSPAAVASADDLEDRRVLVTGATGFLGSHLVRALRRVGADVSVLVRSRARIPFDLEHGVTIHEGDLTDPQAVKDAVAGTEVVFHCAAATGNTGGWAGHARDTVSATEVLCEAAASGGVDRLVHVSSVIVYGLDPGLEHGPVSEDTPLADSADPWAHYQRAKVEAERRVESAARTGLRTTIVRPGVLYGPTRPAKGGVVQVGRWWVAIGGGRNVLPFTHVANAVDALLLAATVPEAVGEAFNIVDEPQVRALEVLNAADGARLRAVPFPTRLAAALAGVLERRRARLGDPRPPKLSRFSVRSATRDITYATDKAHRVLGWTSALSREDAARRDAARRRIRKEAT